MKTFQTQCTDCRHVFTINDSQLAFKNGLARCGHCKKVFSAKDNLVTPMPLSATQKVALAQLKQQPPQPAQNPSQNQFQEAPSPKDPLINSITVNKTALTKKQKRLKTGESLISDETVPDELKQAMRNDNDLVKPINLESSNQVAGSDTGFELDILEDFDLPVTHTASAFQAKTPKAFSPDLTEIGDESWLETLLAEEKIKERDKSFLADFEHRPNGAKSDVADLLDELGVDVVPETALSPEVYGQKLSARLKNTANSQQALQKTSLLSPILWGLGCLLLVALLAVQYVIFNANDLMKDKAHAQTLMSVCQTSHLPCNLAQADLSSIDIKTLSLENNSGKTDILFTLINKSSEPVLYPNLKISFQTNHSHIVTLVLSPEQYLTEKSDRIAPQLINPVKLRVDVPRDSVKQVLIESFY